jgi:hypothetical protein
LLVDHRDLVDGGVSERVLINAFHLSSAQQLPGIQ